MKNKFGSIYYADYADSLVYPISNPINRNQPFHK